MQPAALDMTSDLWNVSVSKFVLSPHQQVCNVVREKCVSKTTQRGDEIHRGSSGKSGGMVDVLGKQISCFRKKVILGSADCPTQYLAGKLYKNGNGAWEWHHLDCKCLVQPANHHAACCWLLNSAMSMQMQVDSVLESHLPCAHSRTCATWAWSQNDQWGHGQNMELLLL